MLLTKKVIDEHIAGKGSGNRTWMLILGSGFIGLGVMLLGAGLISVIINGIEKSSLDLSLIFSVFWVFPGGVLLAVFLLNKKIANELTTGEYYLCEDVCIQKQYDAGDAETPDVYKLYFQKYGKARLEAPLVRTRVAAFWPSYIYEDTRVGDKFYLLCSSSGKVRYVFNRKRWELSGEEFQEKEGEYFPRPE